MGLPADEVQPNLAAIYDQVTDRGPGGHILTGPIHIEGAEPGDVLEVRILSVDYSIPYGYNGCSGFVRDLCDEDRRSRLIRIDTERHRAEIAPGITVETRPFFGSMGGNVVAATRDLGEEPLIADLIGSVKTMLDAFADGTLDKIYLVSNEFVNTMTQDPTVEQILPLVAEDSDEMKHHWDYIYEPEARDLLDGLLARYIESLVYQAVVENGACEQAARMLAMKNATENAGELIDDLQLIYNKARQAAITQELSEIVGGAAAIS